MVGTRFFGEDLPSNGRSAGATQGGFAKDEAITSLLDPAVAVPLAPITSMIIPPKRCVENKKKGRNEFNDTLEKQKKGTERI
jgi:hypothetical protein